jgi:hypothetical protein
MFAITRDLHRRGGTVANGARTGSSISFSTPPRDLAIEQHRRPSHSHHADTRPRSRIFESIADGPCEHDASTLGTDRLWRRWLDRICTCMKLALGHCPLAMHLARGGSPRVRLPCLRPVSVRRDALLRGRARLSVGYADKLLLRTRSRRCDLVDHLDAHSLDRRADPVELHFEGLPHRAQHLFHRGRFAED